MFTKTCKYAIKAMIYMASLPLTKKKAGLKDISQAIDSPEAFTAKILQSLVKDELLRSTKGPNGGFALNGKAEKIFLAQIIRAIDGDALFSGCALGFINCSEKHPCPVHHKFNAIRDHLSGMLLTTNLKDVATRVSSGESFLKSEKNLKT